MAPASPIEFPWPWLVIAVLGFAVFFIALWSGIMLLLSYWSGWRRLARTYRAVTPTTEGQEFRGVTAGIGSRVMPVRYKNCLLVTFNDHGFRLALPRFMDPFKSSVPLFIPWTAVTGVQQSHGLLHTLHTAQLHAETKVITLIGPAGACLSETFSRARPAQR